ncbi:MAG TPA: helix-turn-helix transcriptional regulator [Thermomicrobiales bacterium]|nr:helix-turn-helix transcriptional regulator [Thermomicrobiales bacterium]
MSSAPEPNRPIVRQRIGPVIKALRQAQRISLQTVAGRAGISPSHLSRIERGLTVPSYDVLDRIADAIGSDLTSLRVDEETARSVDERLDKFFDRVGLSPAARQELLQLSPEARAELAQNL